MEKRITPVAGSQDDSQEQASAKVAVSVGKDEHERQNGECFLEED